MQARTRALEHAHLGPPRLPGLRRGARRPLRARRGDARDRRTADRGQRDRLPRGVLDAVPGVVLAAAVAALAVRQRAGGRERARRGAEGEGPDRRPRDRPGRRRRHASTSASPASPGCSSATTTCSTSATTTRRYMNTGVQRSSATPPAARTANTKPVGAEPGNAFGQGKNAPLIAMAHEIPYVATATVAELHDLEAKVERAMEFRGARYLHVLVPCPLGWGAASQRHDPHRPARARRRGSSPSSRPSTARSSPSRRSGARCRSRSTCARSAASRTCSATRRAPT